LDALPRGDCNATGNDSGGGDTESCPRDEIAARDNRSGMFFSWFCADRLGWLLAC
jgi:hypothetical protein